MQPFFRKSKLAAIAIGATFAACSLTPASAATLFTTDYAGSSVGVSPAGGGGITCAITSCGVSAAITSGPDVSFSLSNVGDSQTFNFITWTASGTTGLTPRQLNVTAQLAFSAPAGVGHSTSGTGAAYLFLGVFTNGVLNWTTETTEVTVGDAVFRISFEEGSTFLPLVHTLTTHATVTLVRVIPEENVEPIATPLPLTAPLFGAGLGLLGFLSWRRKQGLTKAA